MGLTHNSVQQLPILLFHVRLGRTRTCTKSFKKWQLSLTLVPKEGDNEWHVSSAIRSEGLWKQIGRRYTKQRNKNDFLRPTVSLFDFSLPRFKLPQPLNLLIDLQNKYNLFTIKKKTYHDKLAFLFFFGQHFCDT